MCKNVVLHLEDYETSPTTVLFAQLSPAKASHYLTIQNYGTVHIVDSGVFAFSQDSIEPIFQH